MTGYNSNIDIVIGGLKEKLVELQKNPDAMLRTVALTVLPEFRKRIHVEGKDSAGNPIGTYSPEYMKIRTGNFGNSGRKVKGKDKGGLKDAGKFTKGSKVGTARPRYNRTADTKVIASLTRQMENDESVLASSNGYGIGFNNPHNFQKSQWVTTTYRKPIFDLTAGEIALATDTAQKYVDDIVK